MVDAGEIEKGVLVVVKEEALGGVVVCVDAVEGGVNDGFDRVEAVEDSLGFVKSCPRAVEVLRSEAELDTGNFDGGVDVGILALGVVDLLAEGLEEL